MSKNGEMENYNGRKDMPIHGDKKKGDAFNMAKKKDKGHIIKNGVWTIFYTQKVGAISVSGVELKVGPH